MWRTIFPPRGPYSSAYAVDLQRRVGRRKDGETGGDGGGGQRMKDTARTTIRGGGGGAQKVGPGAVEMVDRTLWGMGKVSSQCRIWIKIAICRLLLHPCALYAVFYARPKGLWFEKRPLQFTPCHTEWGGSRIHNREALAPGKSNEFRKTPMDGQTSVAVWIRGRAAQGGDLWMWRRRAWVRLSMVMLPSRHRRGGGGEGWGAPGPIVGPPCANQKANFYLSITRTRKHKS